jgi:hypothetical protein
MKLHQLLAILTSAKNSAEAIKTEIYHLAQKTALFSGISRTYSPNDAEGFVYPSESTAVQKSTPDLIDQFFKGYQELWDLAATQDWANTEAKADVVVDGEVILRDVPVTHLLYLEKQVLTDARTFLSKLPILDADKTWTYDSNRSAFVTPARQSVKTKKVSKAIVLYEATKEHPAQVKEVTEDIVEGTWTTIDLSGALPAETVKTLQARVAKLLKAVVIAREEANGLVVTPKTTFEPIFEYLTKDVLELDRA